MADFDPPLIFTNDIVVLVDASFFVHRAYHQSTSAFAAYAPDGITPTGGVRNFMIDAIALARKGILGMMPTHIGYVFDKQGAPSFRKSLYPNYKQRKPIDDALRVQMPLMRDAVRAIGIGVAEQDDYEADDLIATYARLVEESGARAIVVSTDKDLCQVCRVGVSVYRDGKLVIDDGDELSWSVPYEQKVAVSSIWNGTPSRKIVDVQALSGDQTDGVPGAPGVGPKIAAALVAEFGSVEAVLTRASEIKRPAIRQTLMDKTIADQVRMSRELVKLVDDVPLATSLDDFMVSDIDWYGIQQFSARIGFRSLERRATDEINNNVQQQ